MSNLQLKGSIVAIITPFTQDQQVDYDSLRKLVDIHLEAKTDAIVVCGTTGETATLSEAESLEVTRVVAQQVAGRIPVIAGTGNNATWKTVEYTKKVCQIAGVDAVLVVAPYYNKPNQEGIYQHMKAVADTSSLPVVLYNVPGRTVVSMDVDTVVRLASHSNIIAIKDAHPDLSRVTAIVSKTQGMNFIHLSGDDPNAIQSVRLGSSGVISVTANVIPKKWAQVMALANEGKYMQAVEANKIIESLHGALFSEPNPAPSKYLCKQLGMIACDELRLPLLPVTKSTAEKLDKWLNVIKEL